MIIDDNCGYDKFYATADILQTVFNLTFTEKLDGLDASYWDFEFNGCCLTLHYHVQAGLSIFPGSFKEASDADNKNVMEIDNMLTGYFADKRKI